MRIQLRTGTVAELALPGGKPVRGVVLSPDIEGLRPLFSDMAERLAKGQSWAVCVPEPYPGREHLTVDEREIAPYDDPQVIGDLIAAADLLSEAGCAQVAVMGFCIGGMAAAKAAGTGHFDRAVSIYGMIRIPAPWQGPRNVEPLVALARPEACPLLAIIAGKDRWTPDADVADLRAVGNHVTVIEYPNVAHGFVHGPSRVEYQKDAHDDAWRRIISYLSV
jgi:carboxymethylenebutenolidase